MRIQTRSALFNTAFGVAILATTVPGYAQVKLAPAAPVAETLPNLGSVTKNKDGVTPTPVDPLSGLDFGVGLALTFASNSKQGGIREAVVDGNNIVRVTREAKRTPAIMLESHYFIESHEGKKPWLCFGAGKCRQGPFIAIETGGSNRVISAYGLGWMIGHKKSSGDADKDDSDRSSWNIGLGYVVRTGIQTLGDGLTANEPLPAGDKIRYKEVNQPGVMLMVSFAW